MVHFGNQIWRHMIVGFLAITVVIYFFKINLMFVFFAFDVGH